MSLFTTQGYRYRLVAGNDNIQLDTFQDESIKVSNNITELFDIGSVPGTFTRTITLPGTKTNNAFFEQYYDISVYGPDAFDSNQKVAAYLDFASIYLVNGYLQLLKINEIANKFIDSYEVLIYGAISNFSVETNRLFLTDLDNLASYNHSSSYEAITESWKGNLFNGDIVYPMADYGKRIQFSTQDFIGIDDNEDALTVSDYKPAIRMKKIWDAIFDKVGFTYTGSFMQEPWLDDVYVILNNNKRYPEYAYADLETLGQGKVTCITGSADNYTLTNNTVTNFPMGAVNYDYNNFFTVGNPFKYFGSMPSRYLANIQLSYRLTNNGANAQSQYPAFYLHYFDDNGNQINVQTLATINAYTQRVAEGRVGTPTVTENFAVTQQINMPQMTGSINFKILQQAYVASGSAGGIAATPNYALTLNPTSAKDYCSFEVTQVREAADWRVLDIASNMPFGTNGIKLIDFIRSIQKKFNLVIYENKSVPNQMIVETFNTWYKLGSVRDFNNYIDVNEKIEYIPANSLAVNKVSFTDKDDSDYVEKVFKQANNRIYGQAFFIDTGSYFSQGEFNVETSFGSGPIFELPLTVASGSSVTGNTCTSYQINFGGEAGSAAVQYTSCAGAAVTQSITPTTTPLFICARGASFPKLVGSNISATSVGSCTSLPDSQPSSSFLPVAIPLYVGDQNYRPTQVFPRMMFFNGMVSSSQYWIEGQYTASNPIVTANSYKQYPYFDNYNVVTGSFPTTGSRSLLFNNEQSIFGVTPTESLISTYWDKYLGLLYNPRTRLVTAAAVIPLASYFDIEIGNIVQFKSNYYHLRAINDYDLTTGECLVELLGPIITDALAFQFASGSTPFNPPLVNSWVFNYSSASCSASCATGTSTTVYTAINSSSINIGTQLFSTASLQYTASNGYYSSASVCYSVSASGIISSSTFCCTGPTLEIEYLIVAGGGGAGGVVFPGGSGAGGLLSGSATICQQSQSYDVIVGLGGDKSANNIYGPENGSDSSFLGLLAKGGGRGGLDNGAPADGGIGGSGGGPSFYGSAGTGIVGQGNDGNGGNISGSAGAGGGAGGRATHFAGIGNQGGSGSMWLDGKIYAAGAGTDGNRYGYGWSSADATGGGATPNSDGRSGVVIVRYAGSGSQMSGGTITYSGSYTYHTFTNAAYSSSFSSSLHFPALVSTGSGPFARNIVSGSDLYCYLDASNTASYPGSGSIWYDLTSNNLDFAFGGGTSNPTFVSATTESYFNFTGSESPGGGDFIISHDWKWSSLATTQAGFTTQFIIQTIPLNNSTFTSMSLFETFYSGTSSFAYGQITQELRKGTSMVYPNIDVNGQRNTFKSNGFDLVINNENSSTYPWIDSQKVSNTFVTAFNNGTSSVQIWTNTNLSNEDIYNNYSAPLYSEMSGSIIGRTYSSDAQENFMGRIYAVLIYSKPLTQAEITQNKQAYI